ncbi:unnamed protein product [Protopolystoma xenopodis]|uniref:Uncharacterized protein n=1 Tax=Protopolystoma xenopodis TaxID=117903 RepID=A0A448XCL9_9PLAT|nr:unnamed protein product [Protopolystoma xenopodis]
MTRLTEDAGETSRNISAQRETKRISDLWLHEVYTVHLAANTCHGEGVRSPAFHLPPLYDGLVPGANRQHRRFELIVTSDSAYAHGVELDPEGRPLARTGSGKQTADLLKGTSQSALAALHDASIGQVSEAQQVSFYWQIGLSCLLALFFATLVLLILFAFICRRRNRLRRDELSGKRKHTSTISSLPPGVGSSASPTSAGLLTPHATAALQHQHLGPNNGRLPVNGCSSSASSPNNNNYGFTVAPSTFADTSLIAGAMGQRSLASVDSTTNPAFHLTPLLSAMPTTSATPVVAMGQSLDDHANWPGVSLALSGLGLGMAGLETSSVGELIESMGNGALLSTPVSRSHLPHVPVPPGFPPPTVQHHLAAAAMAAAMQTGASFPGLYPVPQPAPRPSAGANDLVEPVDLRQMDLIAQSDPTIGLLSDEAGGYAVPVVPSPAYSTGSTALASGNTCRF